MLKRRDIVAIGNVGDFNSKISSELLIAQTKLKKDVDSILEVYTGIDAEAQVAKFNEDIAKLSTIISNLEYYGEYMKGVSSHDKDNLNRTNQQFGSITKDNMTSLVDEIPDYKSIDMSAFNLSNSEGDIK